MNLLSSAGQLLLAAGILTLAAAVGMRVVRWTRYEPGHPVERVCVAVALGTGALSVALLLAGLAGLLSGAVCWGLLGAALWFSRDEVRRLRPLAREATSSLGRAGRPALLVFGLVLLLMALIAGAPVTDWDSLAYHLPVLAGWLDVGAIVLPPDNLHAAYVGLQHMLYLPALSIGADRTAAFLSMLFAGLLGLTAFSTCDRLFNRRAASLALPLVLSNSVLVLVAVTPRVDTTLAFYLLLGQHLLLVAWREEDRDAMLAAVAVLGLAVGVKASALLYIAVLTPVGVWLAWRHSSGGWDLGGRAARLLVIGLAVAGPWLLKNLLLVGDPVYPNLGGRLLEPWLRPILGGTAVPAEVPEALFELPRRFRVAFNLRDFFLHPARITAEYEAAFYLPSFLLLFVPLWLLRPRKPALLLLGGPALAFGVGVVAWLSGFVNVRYLIPALVPLTLVAVVLIEDLLPPSSALNRAAVIVVAGLGLAPLAYSLAGTLQSRPLTGYYGDRISGAPAYLSASRWPMESELGEIVSYVNEHLDQDARILMLFDSRDYYFEARTISGSNVHTNWPLLARATPAPPCPDEFGATHVLVYRTLPERLVEAGMSDAVLGWRRFEDYRRRCLQPLHSTESHTLYTVRGSRRSWLFRGSPHPS